MGGISWGKEKKNNHENSICVKNVNQELFTEHLLSHEQYWASMVAQMVKHLPAMLETQVWPLG